MGDISESDIGKILDAVFMGMYPGSSLSSDDRNAVIEGAKSAVSMLTRDAGAAPLEQMVSQMQQQQNNGCGPECGPHCRGPAPALEQRSLSPSTAQQGEGPPAQKQKQKKKRRRKKQQQQQ